MQVLFLNLFLFFYFSMLEINMNKMCVSVRRINTVVKNSYPLAKQKKCKQKRNPGKPEIKVIFQNKFQKTKQ